MNPRNKRYAYMAAADDGNGAGGGESAAGAGAAAAATGQGAAAAGGEAAGEGAAAAASLLTTGKGEQPASDDFIPEKFRVMGADGKLDLAASARKVTDSYTELEKRKGGADLPPKTPEEYAPEGLPEGVNIDELKADPLYAGFLKGAHAQGLTNKQVSYVLNEYLARAPQIAQGAQHLDVEGATAKLKEVWTDDAAFTGNLKAAYGVTSVLANKAGIDMALIEGSPIANDPTFLRMMAALAPEFAEDLPAPAGGSSVSAQAFDQALAEIQAHPGYMDGNHPEHKILMQRKQALYDQRYGNKPAAGVTVIPVKT